MKIVKAQNTERLRYSGRVPKNSYPVIIPSYSAGTVDFYTRRLAYHPKSTKTTYRTAVLAFGSNWAL